ncbi:hypothetical protein [Paenibacillus flagellatus]|uniref:Uncharacterized protein n=1 Tax=Paenibacillus flagellatus TaxID=2211139 RepID=A0A2V5KCT0_9BACL|nr:hypothetical protein [Paenibacillus flagellatus]PYI57435.1 hypothetical protein DLM86_03080 [Paenibacillus flagellatus]
MPSFVPYAVLILVMLTSLITILAHFRDYRLFLIFLAYSGMIYVFEYAIVVLMNGYSYYPNLLPIRYLDNLLGSIFSNLLAVPVIALFIAVYRLGNRWILLFALLLSGVEWLFERMGVYETYWWKVPYTTAALLFFFWLARCWIVWLQRGNRAIRYVTLVMYSSSLIDTLVFVLIAGGVRLFRVGVFDDPYRDDVFVSALFGFFKALLLAGAVYWTDGIRWIAAALAAIFAIQIVLIRCDILHVFVPYWLYFLMYAPCCFFVAWLIAIGKRSLNDWSAFPSRR